MAETGLKLCSDALCQKLKLMQLGCYLCVIKGGLKVFRPHSQVFILQNVFAFFSLSTAAVATDFSIRILYLPEAFLLQFNFPYFIGASRNADLQFLSNF